jgi:chromosome segregation ATPase
LSKIADIRSKISNFNALIQSYTERTAVIEKELEDKAKDYENLQKNVKNLENTTADFSQNLDVITKKLDVENSALGALTSDLSKAEADLNNNRQELQQSISRQKLLKDLEKSFDNYSKSVKAVMKKRKNPTKPDPGPAMSIATGKPAANAVVVYLLVRTS